MESDAIVRVGTLDVSKNRWNWIAGLKRPATAIVFASLALLSFAIGSLPLGSAIEFAADERFEFVKGFIYMRWSNVSPSLWNDQPALYSALLGEAFQLIAPSLLVARLIAVVFALLLSAALGLLVHRHAGLLAGIVSVLFLWLSPELLTMFVSVLPEVPAFALGMTSLVCLTRWSQTGRLLTLLCSALVFSCALHVKFTSAILLPALLAELVILTALPSRAENWTWGKRIAAVAKPAFHWAGYCGLGFMVLSLIPPGVRWDQLWLSHMAASGTESFQTWDVYRFNVSDILEIHPEAVIGSLLGFYLLLFSGKWRCLVFPVTLGLTVLLVHTSHRPWWWYYYLHFVIPMAMLSGFAASELTAMVKRNLRKGSWLAYARVLFAVVGGLWLSLSFAFLGGRRFLNQHKWLSTAEVVSQNRTVQEMVKYRTRTRWFYSLDPKYAFLARVSIPPELAILPAKRFQTRQIDYPRILQYLRQYKPEQVLLTTAEELALDWMSFLQESYSKVYEDKRHTLYVLKALAESAAPSHREL